MASYEKKKKQPRVVLWVKKTACIVSSASRFSTVFGSSPVFGFSFVSDFSPIFGYRLSLTSRLVLDFHLSLQCRQ